MKLEAAAAAVQHPDGAYLTRTWQLQQASGRLDWKRGRQAEPRMCREAGHVSTGAVQIRDLAKRVWKLRGREGILRPFKLLTNRWERNSLQDIPDV